MDKLKFNGQILGVQPRIRLIRSFDESSHNYLGYNIFINGSIDEEEKTFCIAIGKAAQVKFGFRTGQIIIGQCLPVSKPNNEVAGFYKVSGLVKIKDDKIFKEPPPYLDKPLKLEEYRKRGHRRLSAKFYLSSCQYCHWACKMATEIFVDKWDSSNMKYRYETFCYGPKSCENYNSGPTRKVPGRNGKVWEEEDWIDVENTAHRSPDE
ncbi:hypothetical protein KAR48_20175 [bacterium]|nr:hypothetical protein [bacterium]